MNSTATEFEPDPAFRLWLQRFSQLNLNDDWDANHISMSEMGDETEKKEKKTVSVALKNEHRNLDQRIIPFDYNRVKIKKKPNNKDGYINASSIVFQELDREYILAAIAPDSEVESFWRMIMEQCVKAIVLFTDPMIEVPDYFPKYKDDSIYTGKFIITCRSYYDAESYEQREIDVAYKNNLHKLYHFNYVAWPKDGTDNEFLDLFSFYKTLQELHIFSKSCNGFGTRNKYQFNKFLSFKPDSLSKTVVLQCLTGAGMSATFLLFDVLLQFMRKDFDVETIENIIMRLKEQRRHCVQTTEQYKVLYEAIIRWILIEYPGLEKSVSYIEKYVNEINVEPETVPGTKEFNAPTNFSLAESNRKRDGYVDKEMWEKEQKVLAERYFWKPRVDRNATTSQPQVSRQVSRQGIRWGRNSVQMRAPTRAPAPAPYRAPAQASSDDSDYVLM